MRPARAVERDLAGLTDAVTPQGVVAVCRMLDRPAAELLREPVRLAVLCVEVRDPGNAGTVIRCADAFGAGAVLLSAGSVDVYNPKTVRASVGSIFHLPLAVDADPAAVVRAARRSGMRVLAADGAGPARLDRLAAGGVLRAPLMWVFGTEATGLPAALTALADEVVSVPLFGAAESLNLASAAAVCLYASATAQAGPGMA